jgi:hypothetical protein
MESCEYDYDVCALQYEYEDQLPEDISDEDFKCMFKKSEVIHGVRMYPYIGVWDECSAEQTRYYLGA